MKYQEQSTTQVNDGNDGLRITSGEQEPLIRTSVYDESSSVWNDCKDTLRLAVPIFFSMISWVGMKTTDTALLGHVSADALSAAALSDLWTMCTEVFIRGRVLGILVGSALGAGNPKLAGTYLQISLLIQSILAIFVIIAWSYTESFWVTLGAEHHVSRMAGYYARVLAVGIPGQIGFSQLAQFFSACPVVTTLAVYAQLFIVLIIYIMFMRLREQCWDGWSWSASLSRQRIHTYMDLYIPASLGMASDYWRVAVVGMLASQLGSMEVAVLNTSYRIMWVVLVATNSISSASGIKTSIRLGQSDAKGAKQAGEIGIFFALIFSAVAGGLIAWHIRPLGLLFTNDEKFLEVWVKAKWPFAATVALMNFSVALERIPFR